jgi:hypothetical protein
MIGSISFEEGMAVLIDATSFYMVIVGIGHLSL